MAPPPRFPLAGAPRPVAPPLAPRTLDGLRALSGDELARLYEHLGPLVLVELVRIRNLVERYAADEALPQRLDDVFPLFEGGHLQAEDGPAILLRDRDVLRHVHEAAGEVAGVRRLP